MNKKDKKVINIFLRYIFLILIALPGFGLLYEIFLPLTKYPVYWFIQIFFDPVMIGNTLTIGPKIIEIVGACVAGSAYYFLLILNLGTPEIKSSLRIKLIFLSFLGFLIVNIIRIIILSVMYIQNSPIFDFVHKLLWYFGSTILIVLIWFLEVKIFKIEKIPFYSDLKGLYQLSSLKKK